MLIKLYWKSLKNEIDAETWKAGKCYITEDQAEKRAEAQVGNDLLDINYCYRKIEQGIMNLQDIAHKFFVEFNRYEIPTIDLTAEGAPSAQSGDEDLITDNADNKLKNKVDYWTITLRFGDRQHVDTNLLATELHKYVVLNVLQEWCKIANPTLTAEYVNRLNAEEVRVKSIMYRKEEPNWDE